MDNNLGFTFVSTTQLTNRDREHRNDTVIILYYIISFQVTISVLHILTLNN